MAPMPTGLPFASPRHECGQAGWIGEAQAWAAHRAEYSPKLWPATSAAISASGLPPVFQARGRPQY